MKIRRTIPWCLFLSGCLLAVFGATRGEIKIYPQPVEATKSTISLEMLQGKTALDIPIENANHATTPSPIVLIANSKKSIRVRVGAVHNLSAHLSSSEIAGLYAFVEAHPDTGENLPALRYLKNEIFTALRSQSSCPDGLTDVLIGISRDTTQDTVTRDYALQHLALWCDEKAWSKVGEAQRIHATLKNLAQQTNVLAGTALLGLHRLTVAEQSGEMKEVKALALSMAENNHVPAPARVIGIAICGDAAVTNALPLLENVARNSPILTLRVAAIAALARLDGPRQAALLRSLELDPEPLVQNASESALRRLDRTQAINGAFLTSEQ